MSQLVRRHRGSRRRRKVKLAIRILASLLFLAIAALLSLGMIRAVERPIAPWGELPAIVGRPIAAASEPSARSDRAFPVRPVGVAEPREPGQLEPVVPPVDRAPERSVEQAQTAVAQ